MNKSINDHDIMKGSSFIDVCIFVLRHPELLPIYLPLLLALTCTLETLQNVSFLNAGEPDGEVLALMVHRFITLSLRRTSVPASLSGH